MGSTMDLAACARRVFIIMEHVTRDGKPRLVARCDLAVTARGIVLSAWWRQTTVEPTGDGFRMREIAQLTVEEVRAASSSTTGERPAAGAHRIGRGTLKTHGDCGGPPLPVSWQIRAGGARPNRCPLSMQRARPRTQSWLLADPTHAARRRSPARRRNSQGYPRACRAPRLPDLCRVLVSASPAASRTPRRACHRRPHRVGRETGRPAPARRVRHRLAIPDAAPRSARPARRRPRPRRDAPSSGEALGGDRGHHAQQHSAAKLSQHLALDPPPNRSAAAVSPAARQQRVPNQTPPGQPASPADRRSTAHRASRCPPPAVRASAHRPHQRHDVQQPASAPHRRSGSCVRDPIAARPCRRRQRHWRRRSPRHHVHRCARRSRRSPLPRLASG